MMKLDNYIIVMNKEEWDKDYIPDNYTGRFKNNCVCGDIPTHFPVACKIWESGSSYSCNDLHFIPIDEAIEDMKTLCEEEIDWYLDFMGKLEELREEL